MSGSAQTEPTLDSLKNHGVTDARSSGSVRVPRKTACFTCRSKKLRCDGAKPTCGTCRRLSVTCEYARSRRKTGPPKGYLKTLTERLTQAEHFFERHGEVNSRRETTPRASAARHPGPESSFMAVDLEETRPTAEHDIVERPSPGGVEEVEQGSSSNASHSRQASLCEDRAVPERIDELHRLYFERIHPTVPILDRTRYMNALASASSVPSCLQYMVWALAATISDEYSERAEEFYCLARKSADKDEMGGYGELVATISHCQTWILISHYEMRNLFSPRAWLSIGKAIRLVQLMQLHRLDDPRVKIKIQPPRDNADVEERRRVFWLAYCLDKYASMATGWPMMFEERDISTNLPSSEDSFAKGESSNANSLQQTLLSQNIETLSELGVVVLMCALVSRILRHLAEVENPNSETPSDQTDEFWNTHNSIDDLLVNITMSLPDRLRLPLAIDQPNVVFAHTLFHALTICHHQAATSKAREDSERTMVVNESEQRCLSSALAIARIMRLASHTDFAAMHVLTPFCLYVAIRVLMRAAEDNPEYNARARFLQQALEALRRKIPLSEMLLMLLRIKDLARRGIKLSEEAYANSPECVKESLPKGLSFTHGFRPIYENREDDPKASTIDNPSGRTTNTTPTSRVDSQDTPQPSHIMEGVQPATIHTQGKRVGYCPLADAEQRRFSAGIFAPILGLDESQPADEALHSDGVFSTLPFETPFDFSNSTGFGFFPLLSYSPDFSIPGIMPGTSGSTTVVEASNRDHTNPPSNSSF